jgi:PBSX family phage terminase large subunit
MTFERKLERRAPYEPFGAARELWRSKAPEILISGPAGTGKTRAILEKILALAVKYQGSRHLICRKTRASMTQSVLVTFEEIVLPAGSKIKSGPARAYRQSYKIGDSEIVIGGLDNPERTFSTEYDTICVFEAIEITEAEWDALQRSLRNGRMIDSATGESYHQAIADTNPGSPAHWLKIRADKERKMLHLKSKHEDNPRFYEHKPTAKGDGAWTSEGRSYISRLQRLTGHLRKRLYEGKWVAAEGVVYEDYDPRHHNLTGKACALRRKTHLEHGHGRLFVTVDWGHTHPHVMQLWGIDSDGRLYLLYEYFMTKKTLQYWVDRAVEWYNTYPTIEAFVPDPSEPGHIQEFENAGLPVVLAYNDILHGIKATQERMKLCEDGKPRILFCENNLVVERDDLLVAAKTPASTLEEMPSYTWKLDQNGRPMKKERPTDEHNHGMDTMRYAVAYADNLASAMIQREGHYAGVGN